MKEYVPHFGFPMDQKFEEHRKHCAQCEQYVSGKSATAALVCLEGAILLKAQEVTRPTQQLGPTDEHRVSTKEAKAGMRYK